MFQLLRRFSASIFGASARLSKPSPGAQGQLSGEVLPIRDPI